jgi:hypothetical protein
MIFFVDKMALYWQHGGGAEIAASNILLLLLDDANFKKAARGMSVISQRRLLRKLRRTIKESFNANQTPAESP